MNSVCIAHVIHLAQGRYVAVPAELGGCIVLGVLDQLIKNTVPVETGQVFLFEDGTLRVSGEGTADEWVVEAAMRHLLQALLATAITVPPALQRAASRPPGGDLVGLVRELEVALVPTNRGAAKRALARLCREATRVITSNPELLAKDSADVHLPDISVQSPIPSAPVAVVAPLSEPVAVAEIPDLEVPRVKVQNPSAEPAHAGESIPSVYPAEDAAACEPVELSDADLESVQCPEVCRDGVPLAREAPACVVDNTEMKEVTAPFPLTQLAKSPAPRSSGPTRISSRLRMRPIFRAIQVDPDITMPMLAARLEPSVESAPPHDPEQSRPLAERPQAAVGQIDALLTRADRHGLSAREEGMKAVTGPHQFVTPARFAKKTGRVAERVSQFASNQSIPTDLAERLEEISDADAVRDDKEAPADETGTLLRDSHRHAG